MGSPTVAVLGGSGLESLFPEGKKARIGTPYGPSPPVTVKDFGEVRVAFLSRHGPRHEAPPHKVNYRANIWALKSLGVERIVATNAVGAINLKYKPGDLAIPVDIIDFTKARAMTFYDTEPVTHIDVTEPYCPQLRSFLIGLWKNARRKLWTDSVLVTTEGPRYETPAEIKMLRQAACDIVGMTGSPETFLARELEMCYVAVCYVSNMAAGIQERLSAREVLELGGKVAEDMRKMIHDAISSMPKLRSCRCGSSLNDARA